MKVTLVLIKNLKSLSGLNKKLSPNFKGLYKIIKVNDDNNIVQLKIKNKKVT